MRPRDLATVTMKTLAVWFFANGIAGVSSTVLTWSRNVSQYGIEGSILSLASSGIFIPVGAVGWLVSDSLARRIFQNGDDIAAPTLERADLYAFASVLVGLFLLADALPQIVYWLVVWRMARGTGFWEAAAPGVMDDSVVYWVSARAQVGAVATKAILGSLLVCGPERIARGLARIRKEFFGSLSDDEPEGSVHPPDSSGGV